jgi:hypothetical protein
MVTERQRRIRYKIGDRVKWIYDTTSHYIGSIGTITNIDVCNYTRRQLVWVKLDNGTNIDYKYAFKFEKVDDIDERE